MSDEGITGDVCEGRLYNIMQEKHAMDIIIFLYRTGGAKESPEPCWNWSVGI